MSSRIDTAEHRGHIDDQDLLSLARRMVEAAEHSAEVRESFGRLIELCQGAQHRIEDVDDDYHTLPPLLGWRLRWHLFWKYEWRDPMWWRICVVDLWRWRVWCYWRGFRGLGCAPASQTSAMRARWSLDSAPLYTIYRAPRWWLTGRAAGQAIQGVKL